MNIYQTGYDTISMNVAINGVSTPIMTPSYSGLMIEDHPRLVDNSATGKLVIDGTFNRLGQCEPDRGTAQRDVQHGRGRLRRFESRNHLHAIAGVSSPLKALPQQSDSTAERQALRQVWHPCILSMDNALWCLDSDPQIGGG